MTVARGLECLCDCRRRRCRMVTVAPLMLLQSPRGGVDAQHRRAQPLVHRTAPPAHLSRETSTVVGGGTDKSSIDCCVDSICIEIDLPSLVATTRHHRPRGNASTPRLFPPASQCIKTHTASQCIKTHKAHNEPPLSRKCSSLVAADDDDADADALAVGSCAWAHRWPGGGCPADG